MDTSQNLIPCKMCGELLPETATVCHQCGDATEFDVPQDRSPFYLMVLRLRGQCRLIVAAWAVFILPVGVMLLRQLMQEPGSPNQMTGDPAFLLKLVCAFCVLPAIGVYFWMGWAILYTLIFCSCASGNMFFEMFFGHSIETLQQRVFSWGFGYLVIGVTVVVFSLKALIIKRKLHVKGVNMKHIRHQIKTNRSKNS